VRRSPPAGQRQRIELVRRGSKAMAARQIGMTDSTKQTMSAVVSTVAARALVNIPRAGRDLATVTLLISISLIVTKDSS